MPESNQTFKVSIDPELCTGHGRCYRLAPDIFAPDDEEKGQVILPTVGADKWEELDRAVKLCPEQAIRADPVS